MSSQTNLQLYSDVFKIFIHSSQHLRMLRVVKSTGQEMRQWRVVQALLRNTDITITSNYVSNTQKN